MPRLKLTQRTIEKLPAPDPSGRQLLHWDTDLRGFGVLCSGKTNAKTYVVQRDLPNGRTRRVTPLRLCDRLASHLVGFNPHPDVQEHRLYVIANIEHLWLTGA